MDELQRERWRYLNEKANEERMELVKGKNDDLVTVLAKKKKMEKKEDNEIGTKMTNKVGGWEGGGCLELGSFVRGVWWKLSRGW